jgi:YbgC/YbaW family acyl-CoA thioester hydrolase
VSAGDPPGARRFELRRRARFQDVDAAGIVFFARFFEYAHEAFEEWMRAAGLAISARLRAGDVGMPLAHAEADFHAPTRHDETLVVTVEVARLGESSVGFSFSLLSEAGEARATVRTTHVCIDRASFRPRPWPAEMRAAIEAAR